VLDIQLIESDKKHKGIRF